MIIAIGRLSFNDVFEDIATGRLFSVRGIEGSMVEVKEVGIRKYSAWPSQAKVKIDNETWEHLKKRQSTDQD